METRQWDVIIREALHSRTCRVCERVIKKGVKYLHIQATGWNGRYHNVCQDCVAHFSAVLMTQ